MGELFVSVVNMSISASWVVLAVIILRWLFGKAPKWINPIFWGIGGLRLVIPLSMESVYSLIPSAQSIRVNNLHGPVQMFNTGIEMIDRVVNPAVNESLAQRAAVSSLKTWTSVLAVVWISGMIFLMVYTLFSYLRLSRRVDTAVRLRDNIFCSENVTSPFVLGFCRPNIYLPFGLPEKELVYVIAHEQAHIERRDHLTKAIGFLILSIHWFNPVLWAAYIMLCRDIEAACDERVIRELNTDQRADYSEALLSCSVSRARVSACPIAFGEQGVKSRVRNVLRYQKPARGLTLLAVGACVIVAICFLTSPETASLEEITEEKGYVFWFRLFI